MPKPSWMKAALAALLLAVTLVPSAAAYRLQGVRWPTTTITYYNEVPPYNWSVDTAAYAWNASGARVKFLKTARRDAKVIIGIRWYKPAGHALVYRSNGRISAVRVGVRSGQDRYTMALVLAHELGHALGLAHEDRACAAMNTYLDGNHPERCPAAPDGTWVCRLLRADDVRGAIALYGGSVRPFRGPEFCPR